MSKHEMNYLLRSADAEQKLVMPKFRDGLLRIFGDKSIPSEAKANEFLGGFNRRSFLVRGGTAAAAGAVLVACGNDDDAGTTGTTAAGGDEGEMGEMEENGGGNETDITVARTAASLELYAVNVYDTAIANAEALGITAPVAAAATLFRDHHDQHAAAFNAAAVNMGGEAYNDPNPTAAAAFEERVAGLAAEADVVAFAIDLEQVAAHTYQGVGVTSLSTPALRQTAMSVGGVETRHLTFLRIAAGQDANPVAFQPVSAAIDASFFV